MPSRDTAMAAGSVGSAPNSTSGMGCSHGTSGAWAGTAAAGWSPGAPSPDGSGRRLMRGIAVRHTLVAI
ncbi:MAG TPA: hypothetical protein VGL63_08350 [Streptosporangiaceae bacterium]